MPENSRCKIYPQVIPAEWRNDWRRVKELILYDALKENLPAGWIVIYDVHWLGKVYKDAPKDGQVDFIVMHPAHGVLLIELKGGEIKYDAATGKWTSTEKSGKVNEIKDAFDQVERGKHALKNYFKFNPKVGAAVDYFYHAVCFPEVAVSAPVRLDAPVDIIIDRDDLNYLEEKILAIFKYWNGHKKPGIEKSAIDALVQSMGSSIELTNPLAAQIGQENNIIIQLTESQFSVLDSLRRNRRALVTGCAGSGKTFLALEKARRMSADGFRTLVLCYNTHLAHHFQQILPASEHLMVRSFLAFCHESGASAGLAVPPPNSLTVQEANSEYPMLLTEALSRKPELKFDAIIVDEAQDLYDDWWDALDICLKDEKAGIIHAFADNNQRIYRGTGEAPPGYVHYDLPDNIRNTKPIFRCVEYYYEPEERKHLQSRGPDGRPVEWHKYKTTEDMAQMLNAVIERLTTKENIQGKDIIVLTPHQLENKSDLLNLTAHGGPRLVAHGARRSSNDIGASTIKRFKGLESNIVIVAELDERIHNRPELELLKELYVGLSRAKNHLVIMRNHKLKDGLLPV